MLVLGRRQNEVIYLGDDVRITVAEVRGDLVKIGVEAPDDLVVLRGELKLEALDAAGREKLLAPFNARKGRPRVKHSVRRARACMTP